MLKNFMRFEICLSKKKPAPRDTGGFEHTGFQKFLGGFFKTCSSKENHALAVQEGSKEVYDFGEI